MDINNVWINGTIPIGRWYENIYCKVWHERFRFWLIKLLIKSLYKSKNICYTRLDTGCSVKEEILK